MNTDHDFTEQNFPDALRWSLRGLRREAQPEHDLWPSIAHRIAATPQVAPAPATQAPAWRRFAPLAVAASLALAVGLVWQLRPASVATGSAPGAQLISAEAGRRLAMTKMRSTASAVSTPPGMSPR